MGKLVLTLAEQEEVPPTRGLTSLSNQLFGNSDLRSEESGILRIAWEAVERRRQAARERGEQLLFNGTVKEAGYTTYDDYEQYMKRLTRQEQLEISGHDLHRVRCDISEALQDRGWKYSPGHPETRFYPPKLSYVC